MQLKNNKLTPKIHCFKVLEHCFRIKKENFNNSLEEVILPCCKLAWQNLPVGEPLDWMETAFLKKWKVNGKVEIFNWDQNKSLTQQCIINCLIAY